MRTSVCFLFFGMLELLAARNGDGIADKNFTGVLGQSVTLQCPKTRTISAIRLYIQKGDEPKTEFINGFDTEREEDLYRLVKDKYKNRTIVNRTDLSMEMKNISIHDEGKYECIVFYPLREKEEFSLHLKVTAEYSVPNLTANCGPVTGGNRCDLSCSSTGGYPQSDVKWAGLNSSLISDVQNSSFHDQTSKTWTISQTLSYQCISMQSTNISCSVGTSVSQNVTICVKAPDPKFPLVVISAIAVLMLILIFPAVYIIKRWCVRRRLPPENPELGLPLNN